MKEIFKNKFITIVDEKDSYVINDTQGKFITRIYTEDYEKEELQELLVSFANLIQIENEEELIKKLQDIESALTNCYYDNAIVFFKNAYRYEIADSQIAQDMADMLDEDKVSKYLSNNECVNKIGKYYIVYDC